MSTGTFHHQPWEWVEQRQLLRCHYAGAGERFVEEFDFATGGPLTPRLAAPLTPLTRELAAAFDLLSVTAGISYFKTAAFDRIVLEGLAGPLDGDPDDWAGYVEELYDHGLRELRVQNDLAVPFVPEVEVGRTRRQPSGPPEREDAPGAAIGGPLLPMGGGRDSLLVAHALRARRPSLMTVGRNPIVELQAQQLQMPLHVVRRRLDPRLAELNAAGARNGHVPVTAINSCVAICLALLVGHRDVVIANERSANTPTRIVDGIEVNHQYSKSAAYERLLRTMLARLGVPVRYFSALRDLGEIEISRRIARHWDALPPFVSCNRTRAGAGAERFPTWCGDCAKCYFVFLALAPFVPRHRLVERFGRDLLGSPDDARRVEELLLVDDRDFECLGTPGETRWALQRAAASDWRDIDALRALADAYPAGADHDGDDHDDDPDGGDAEMTHVPAEYRRLMAAV